MVQTDRSNKIQSDAVFVILHGGVCVCMQCCRQKYWDMRKLLLQILLSLCYFDLTYFLVVAVRCKSRLVRVHTRSKFSMKQKKNNKYAPANTRSHKFITRLQNV